MSSEPGPPVIYSIGHSRHPLEDFVSLLKKHAIEKVVDVRGQPYSRRFSQYNRERLRISLESCGIGYAWQGDFLSGRPKPMKFYGADGKVLWEELRKWPALHQALDELVEDAGDQRLAMMCAEEDPDRCHRRFLLTPPLLERGVTIRHIRGDGRLENENDIRKDGGPDQMDLFARRG
ncbi:MAG: DUF488 domain-containing protein [Gammaproteobacteria bacterium]|nr:DUF488 domain-containing protein [Gammaproteobacteria bacterium]